MLLVLSECSLSANWLLTYSWLIAWRFEPEWWILTALDKLEPNGQTEIVTPWAPWRSQKWINILDLTIFLMFFLSFFPKLIRDPLMLPEIFKEKLKYLYFLNYNKTNLLKRWDWARVFLVQICNGTPSNSCCCFHCKTKFNLKTDKKCIQIIKIKFG